MKKITKNTIITSGVVALALIANPTYASVTSFEENFKKELLNEIELQIKSDTSLNIDLTEVEKEIDELSQAWDLKETLVDELKEEIDFIDNKDLKETLFKKLDILKKQEEGKKFYNYINGIYEQLDQYYETHYYTDEYIDENFEDQYEYNFTDNKKEIIDALNQELSYIDYKNLQDTVSMMVKELNTEDNEDIFYDKLEKIYNKLDEYYGENIDEEFEWEGGEYLEYDFNEDKNDTIEYLEEEVNFIDDTELKTNIIKMISELKFENDEEAYFEKIETIYNILDAHYETEGINFDEEFNFESEKTDVLNYIESEIEYITDENIKKEFRNKLQLLKNEMNIDDFFDNVDDLYEKLDEYFIENNEEY